MAQRIWRAVAELAASQHGVVTRSQAAAHNITQTNIRTELGHGRLIEPVRGVLCDPLAPRSWRQSIMIAVLATGGVASGLTAAALHGLEGLEATNVIEVTVSRGGRRAVPGVVVRSTSLPPAHQVTTVDHIPTFSLARTLAELGRDVDDDGVERALDALLRSGVSLRWITATLDEIGRPGASGTAALARVLALPDRQGRVHDSFRERVTERLLARADLGAIERQHPVFDDGGTFLGRLDLAVVDARVGIEYHSDQWHFGPRKGRGDRRRDLAMAGAGWEVLYIDAADHRSPNSAVALVAKVVSQRRASIV